MARRQHHNSISLFPFLAVLVCAMGSLILLLLVMTRKMRNDQQEDAAAAAAVVMASDGVSLDRSAEIADLETRIAAAQSSLTSLKSKTEAVRIQVSERSTQIAALKQDLTSLESRLQNTAGDPKAQLSETLKAARELKAKEAALLRQLAESEKVLLEKQQQLAKAADASEEAELRLQEKHSDLVRLRVQVETAESKARTVSGTSTLLEFSNPTGTARTPIVVNVSSHGFEILPNGVVITPAEMEGFPVRDNPLLSAVLTTHRLRSKNSVTDEPYVLLLVRPDGSLPFYAAQRILTESGIHYGYELLEPEQAIVAGEDDPAEVPAVKASIAEALRRRENMYAKLMEIAQQQSVVPQGAGGAKANERRLTVRPDGRVALDEGPVRRPVDGRFYAGGVAPPASLLQNRPYRNSDPDKMSPAEAEKLADEFAERYAKQQTMQPAETGNERFSSKPASSSNGGDSMRSDGERRFAESLFGNDGSLKDAATKDSSPGGPSTTETASADGSTFAGTTTTPSKPVPYEDRGFVSSLASKPSTSNKSQDSEIPMSPAESLLASGGESKGLPSTGAPDLSRVDPDLLKNLAGGRNTSGSLATPVGITVFLDEHHMTVGQQSAAEMNPDRLNEAFVALLTGINTEVNDAKLKPDEPVMPVVKFIVSPGGERWRIPLSKSLKTAGIRSATVYEITPYMMTEDTAGRARVADEKMN
jgi:hypothetical protein